MRLQLTTKHRYPRLYVLAITIFGSAWLAGTAVRADDVSGTWTGIAYLSMNYYYEGSTRVIMPESGLTLETPEGLRVGASGLVDIITSASIAAGRPEDQLQSEYRYGLPQLSLGKTFKLSGTKLAVDALGRFSTETDYRSLSAALQTSLSFNEDNTVLRAAAAHLQDTITSNADPSFTDDLRAWSGSLGVEQVLNPTTVLTVTYQIGHQTGFLGNAYRSVQLEGAPQRERPPRLRVRHGLSARCAWYIPEATLAVHVLQRAYIDSWNVKAIAPELRLYKELGHLLLARLRYRFYRQGAADFFRESYPRTWDRPFTADPKLAAFDSHTVGLRLDLDTLFLNRTFLDFAADSTVYLSLDRVFSSIPSYGDQIVGSGGGLVRF